MRDFGTSGAFFYFSINVASLWELFVCSEVQRLWDYDMVATNNDFVLIAEWNRKELNYLKKKTA